MFVYFIGYSYLYSTERNKGIILKTILKLTIMKTINELIEKITEDYRVVPFDDYEFENYLKSNALEAMGFGQDAHSDQGSPSFSVYKLDKKDWITVNGNVCEASL